MSLASPAPAANPPHDPYAPLRIANFRWFVASILTMAMGAQVQGVVGLAEAAPFVGFALYAGHVADVRDRRRVALVSLVILFACAAALAVASAIFFAPGR